MGLLFVGSFVACSSRPVVESLGTDVSRLALSMVRVFTGAAESSMLFGTASAVEPSTSSLVRTSRVAASGLYLRHR